MDSWRSILAMSQHEFTTPTHLSRLSMPLRMGEATRYLRNRHSPPPREPSFEAISATNAMANSNASEVRVIPNY
jgi:hypothetical protein